MRQRRHGFTLVELLVVIGIIGVLVSVLMPALNQARSAAKLVQCQSNFKQVHNAIVMYTVNNGGFLPYASVRQNGTPWGAHGLNAFNLFEIALNMGYPNMDPDKWESALPSVFACVEGRPAEDEMAGTNIFWAPHVQNTIRWNPRAFPGHDQIYHTVGKTEWPQRKISTIRKSSEKIAFYEGAQVLDWNLCAVPSNAQLEGWRVSGAGWGHKFIDPDPTGWDNTDKPIFEGPNIDHNGWWNQNYFRYRHNKQKMAPFAFFDGHVEVRRPGEVRIRELCINK